MLDSKKWEAVMGLEVHLQLATISKIFSGSSTTFGGTPNSQACSVDLAMPGTLPVFNELALKFAVMFGLGIDAEINKISVFDRKNYFYPDLPKGYQISQLHHPIIGRGTFELFLGDKTIYQIGITRAHLEEDAGKSVHSHFDKESGIDLNRAGVPLLEIVTDPDFRSSEQVISYLKALHILVTYLGISDGNMAEGSMRCDVNISLREQGTDYLGTRTEIKNINSFRFIERAISFETNRQIDILEDGGEIIQETRLYDSELDETRSMRSKEIANDYRYFPEPDLLPIHITDDYISKIRDSMPELPLAKRSRFIETYDITEYDADVLISSREIADYFEEVVTTCMNSKLAANWIQTELLAKLNKSEQSISESPVSAKKLGLLLSKIVDETISGKIAKQVFSEIWSTGEDPLLLIEKRNLKQMDDSNEIESIVQTVIEQNADQVKQYLSANEQKRKKLLGYFVGQIMKSSNGKANPKAVNQILSDKLSEKS